MSRNGFVYDLPEVQPTPVDRFGKTVASEILAWTRIARRELAEAQKLARKHGDTHLCWRIGDALKSLDDLKAAVEELI